MAEAAQQGTLGAVKKFFGFESNADFLKEWKQLSDEEKEQFRNGIADGSLTY